MNNCITASGLIAAALLAVSGCAITGQSGPGQPEYMVVGIDNKVTWGDDGKVQNLAPGKDAVTIVDIGTDPANPKIVASLPLMNSIFGPPTNLAITPNGQLALVANSMDWVADGPGWKASPDNRLYVIDLTTNPPERIDTVAVGKQPSGMAINRAGNLALVANRADNSISVLSIQGKQVRLVDTVTIGEQVAHVAFTPDGKRALAAKFPGHKVALLDVDGQKVTYMKRDLPVGLWPYNLDITPDGKLALTADNGNAGGSDGNVDTVSVIDLEATPPRVIDKVVVGDAPEGFAISPTGRLAVAILLRGSNNAPTNWFYNRDGSVVVLRIDGKKVTKVGEVLVRGLPEGAVFSPDGKWLYVGNFMDSDISVLRVDGDTVTNTGTLLKLPGRPASMRGRTQ
ncbi:MAG: beta-propeller fold lactonase family protein [Burkholderiales bacterium]|nr:MAG: beta-propeller fold lactonase family protein [Burkholderiales bacterium]